MSLLVGLALPAASFSAPSSLSDGPGPAPGPKLLYADPPKPAPPLRNAGPWRARPLLVSGAFAYRKSEFIYQDYLYDDHGARGISRDPRDPRSGDDLFSAPNGTYTYPADVERYRNNIADIVELRIRAEDSKTLFRLTFNSMTDPGLVATTIALGESEQPVQLPFSAGASAPAEHFLFVRGAEASLHPGAAPVAAGPAPSAEVSLSRHQITVAVPRRTWDPGRRSVRVTAAAGLWDEEAGEYMRPGVSATASRPGGAAGLLDPTAIFNVVPRRDEPLPDVGGDPLGSVADSAWWRDKRQGADLAAGDLSGSFADVDFAKLRDRIRDDSGIPTSGPINRIMTTRFAAGQGVEFDVAGCGTIEGCPGQYIGPLQPYSVYIPERASARSGWGLTLLLHSLGASYNQFHGSRNQEQFGERGRGHVVLTTSNKGPDSWYFGPGGAETFEAWADIARHYPLDPSRSAITGYSMGGYGTYKYATQFPDLFAAGQPTVGPPQAGISLDGGVGDETGTMAQLPSLRHVPMMIWNGVADELVPYASVVAQADAFAELGLRHRFDSFPTAEHFTFAVNDQYAPAAEFLGDRRIDPDPHHVTFVRQPAWDEPEHGVVADHAYWISKIRTRDAGRGNVDAVSAGFGITDPPVGELESGPGVLSGGSLAPLAFLRREIEWGRPGETSPRDRLELTLENIASLRIDPKRAQLSCDAEIELQSDGPVEVRLAGCPR